MTFFRKGAGISRENCSIRLNLRGSLGLSPDLLNQKYILFMITYLLIMSLLTSDILLRGWMWLFVKLLQFLSLQNKNK